MSEEYSLKESAEKLGKLVPIIEDAFGNIIDGFHREKLDPNWPRVRLDYVDDPIKLEKARIAINQCRRVVDAEERGKSYGKLIEMTGWTPQELAENMGLSYRTVMRYLPDKSKEKPQLEERLTQKAQLATVASQQIPVKNDVEVERETPEIDIMHAPIKPSTTQEMPATRVPCDCCDLSVFYPKTWKGATVCGLCYDKLEKGIITLPRRAAEQKTKPQIIEPPKYKEPWLERKAHMAPQISQMETLIAKALTAKAVSFESQKLFCLQATTPDFWFPKQNLACYLDGLDVHRNRQDKDELLRELLTKRHGVRVLSITYEGTGQTEQDRVLAEITEAVQ